MSGLAEVETALVEYVGDVLVNDCGRPAPERVLRYHGIMPHDCCTEAGFLVVSWATMYGSTAFPGQASGQAPDPCAQAPVATLTVRYVICWPSLEGTPPEVTDGYITEVDTKAAMLADVADCVTRALIRLSCAGPDPADPYVGAIIDATRHNWVRYIDTTPILPAGMCAGVAWRVYAAPRHGMAVS